MDVLDVLGIEQPILLVIAMELPLHLLQPKISVICKVFVVFANSSVINKPIFDKADEEHNLEWFTSEGFKDV